MTQWQTLVDYKRGSLIENVKLGAIAWVSGNQVLHEYGAHTLVYGHSTVKPLHMKVFTKELSKLNTSQQAMTVSSHNAEAIHIETVKSILSPDEYGMMQTPHAKPLQQFGKQLRRPRRWYHTCSGEHAGILKGCKLKNWERSGYNLPHHKFHQSYLNIIREVLGKNWEPKFTAKDGCGLATVSYTLSELAQLFSFLVREKEADWIWSAMVKHPDLIGGFNRLDSTILKSCKGKVIAKEGAEGLLGLSIEHEDYPDGLGVFVKLAHGLDFQAMWYIARAVLGVLDIDLRNPYKLHRQMPQVNENMVPQKYRSKLKEISFRDSWDPLDDVWEFNHENYVGEKGALYANDC